MTTPPSTSSSSHRRVFTLIWLDSLVNKSQENIDVQGMLRKLVDGLITFASVEPCLEYIENASEERLLLIVSGRLGQEIVPRIHHNPHVVAIYVYCSDKKRNEEWAKNFLKVKDVIVTLTALMARIQSDQVQRDEYPVDQSLPLSLFQPKSVYVGNATIDNEEFFRRQLLTDCLSRMKANADVRKNFIAQCQNIYKDNPKEWDIIEEFEEKYSAERAIWWLTRDVFLGPMLNEAFRTFDVDLLYHFHFFIHDVREQLDENKCATPSRTYRAQLMSDDEVQLVKSSLDGFMFVNAFLLTVPSRKRALELLENATPSDNLKRVLFEITADPRLDEVKPFSDVTSWCYLTGTEVTLFMAGAIFHPSVISEVDDTLIVQMELCGDTHPKIKPTLDNIKAKWGVGETNLLSFGHILAGMKRFDDAQKYFHGILNDMPHDYHTVARCYQGLGDVAMQQEDYDACLQWHQKALDTKLIVLRSEDPEIAAEYSNIANVHVKKGALTEALELYTQALQIWTRALGKEHPKVATCCRNMACVFQMEERYSEALEYFKKAVSIRQKCYSGDQLELVNLHNHIAEIYVSTGELTEALAHRNAAHQILAKAHSSKHPEVLSALRSIGLLHEALGNVSEALAHFEKVASKRRKLLPPDHVDLMQITQDINRVSSRLNEKS